MARIDGLLFGYTVFKVKKKNISAFVNALLSLGISAKIMRKSRAEIRFKDRSKLLARIAGRIDYEESELCGLPGFLYRNRKRYGTLLGIIAAVFILIFSSGFVWNVRLDGLEGEALESALSALSELGIREGARWGQIDKNELEAKLLARSPDIAWININRRGTVAYITVGKRESFSSERHEPLYSNILASEDGVIEEINVKSGYALVGRGDAVRRGDVLISGVIPSELGGGFCRAEGTVIARVSERYSVTSTKNVSEKHYTDEIKSETDYKILGFSVNILKNSRNLPSMCDIIEYKSKVTLFGKTLPIEKRTVLALSYTERSRELSTDELLSTASSSLRELLSEKLADSELLKISTGGEYTEDGYIMYSDVSVLKNIAEEKEFSVN